MLTRAHDVRLYTGCSRLVPLIVNLAWKARAGSGIVEVTPLPPYRSGLRGLNKMRPIKGHCLWRLRLLPVTFNPEK